MAGESSNRRVAKNTLILYVRMFITMAINMWTSRIVLNALGFTDQGLYNLVGGFVGMLSLVTGAINGAFSRFLTYEVGKGSHVRLNKIFRNATTVQWGLSLIIFVLAETVGLWFVINKMVIPQERMHAVLIVYQLSILTFIIELISSAPSALVIAYEKMSFYATISIVNAVGKLLIAYIIAYADIDKLVLYGFLLTVLSLCTRLIYTLYCKRAFPFIKIGFSFDRDCFIPIFSFAGWSTIGSFATVFRSSGTSILLNLFGGPIANTINGIAHTTNNLVSIFVNDFSISYKPQITKKYASEADSLVPFLHQCSKFTYCLLLVMAIPIMINVEPLLILWFKRIPEGTVIFVRLIIIYSMIEGLCKPLISAKNATGDIRNYQIVVGGILLFTIPISYVFLKIGLPLYFSYIAIIITSLGAFLARMVMLKGSIPGWSSRRFLATTVLRCILATAASFIIPCIMQWVMPDDIWSVLFQCFVGFLWCCICVYFIACNNNERQVLFGMFRSIMGRFIVKR